MHSDNGIFTSDQLCFECDNKHQEQYFSGFVAQHHNSRAERAIQTSMYMARIFMVHYSLYWIDKGANDMSLWSFAINKSVWLHNCLPNYRSVITPLELITINKADHCDLSRSNVWRSPLCYGT